MIKIHVNPGEEVMEIVTKNIKNKRIREGVIISVIGAVDECCISTMPKNDAKKDILKEYKEPLEMLGNGEIREGKPHIHCVFGREENPQYPGTFIGLK